MSRLSSISDTQSGETDAAYKYLGVGTIAVEGYGTTLDDSMPEIKLYYDPLADNSYSGFDRFGRVADQHWANYGATRGPEEEYGFTYDPAGTAFHCWRRS
jgi:hypothetical protein